MMIAPLGNQVAIKQRERVGNRGGEWSTIFAHGLRKIKHTINEERGEECSRPLFVISLIVFKHFATGKKVSTLISEREESSPKTTL